MLTPFKIIGANYTGTLTITEDEGFPKKICICLFICASTRAMQYILLKILVLKPFYLSLEDLQLKDCDLDALLVIMGPIFKAHFQSLDIK